MTVILKWVSQMPCIYPADGGVKYFAVPSENAKIEVSLDLLGLLSLSCSKPVIAHYFRHLKC